jgi:hypothetical protein
MLSKVIRYVSFGRVCINRAKTGGRPLRWMEDAPNNARELASFMTTFADDSSPMYTYKYKHNGSRIRAAIRLALGGARWIPGRVGRCASPISQDSIAASIAYAAEHLDGIAPERFVHFVFDSTSSIFGRCGQCGLPIGLGMLDSWEEIHGKNWA